MHRDGAIGVFDLETCKLLVGLPVLDDPAEPMRLRLHPDGVRLFATSGTATLAWNIDNEDLIETYEREPIAFVGNDLAVSDGLVLWDLATMAELHTTPGELAGMLGDHALLVDGSLWNLRTGEQVWTASARGAATVDDVAILASPGTLELRGAIAREYNVPFADLPGPWTVRGDLDVVFVVGAGPECFAIDLTSGTVIAMVAPGALSWSDGHAIVDGCVYDRSGRCLLRAPGQVAVTGDRAVWNDGYRLRVHALDGTDLCARVAWLAIDPTGRVAIDAHRVVQPGGWRIPDGAFAIGDERIAAGDGVFDLAGTRLQSLPASSSLAVCGELVASCDGAEVRVADARIPGGAVLALDSTRIAVRTADAVELWRLARRLHRFESFARPTCAQLAGHYLIIGFDPGAILVHDTETGKRHAMWEGGSAVTRVAIRGTRIAACRSSGNITLWELTDHSTRVIELDEAALDLAWRDDHTLVCATIAGLALVAV